MSSHPPKLYLDTETCGLHSMMVLLQYAVEDGPIVLYEVWRRPIRETLALIEWICQHTVVGFNLSFRVFPGWQVLPLLPPLCPGLVSGGEYRRDPHAEPKREGWAMRQA